MSVLEIILIVALVIAVIVIFLLLFKDNIRKFIIEKMEEAEASGKSGFEKLKYVLDALKEKYKVMQFIVNARKFIEFIISLSKNINAKK